jgi:hypothetical protein
MKRAQNLKTMGMERTGFIGIVFTYADGNEKFAGLKSKMKMAGAKGTFYFWLWLLTPWLAVSQSYLDQFPLREQTKYFDFRYKQHPEKVKDIARFADGFILLVKRDFLQADFDYPIRVLVLEDRASFQKFLRQQFNIADPPNFGIFLPPYKLFATYEDSGLGTFAHEIMHPLVERNLKDRPIWAIEGIPTFFEKFYGYWQGNDLVVQWGYQNPWRIDMLGANLTRLDLKQIVSTKQTPGEYRESDRRLVSMFLWQQVKFKRFLELIQKRQKNGYDTYFEAALEMPIDRAIPLWQDFLNSIAARRNEILTLPASTVLPDAAAYQKFTSTHGIPATAK